jgi:putative sterol carrier protein
MPHQQSVGEMSDFGKPPGSSEVARAIGELSDDDLRSLLTGGVRELLLDEVFRRFPDHLDPASARDADAAFAFDVTGREDGRSDRYVVALAAGRCEAGRHVERAPAVTYSLDAVDFLKLVTGNVNPATLVLGGRLRLEGDERLAMALTDYFRAPAVGGRDPSATDPRAVDAVEIAREIENVSEKELRTRLRGTVRDLVLEEIFRRFPDYLDERRAANEQAAIAWKITGREDGGYDRYVVVIDRGSCRTGRDLDVEPRVTIRLDAAYFLKVVTGGVSPTLGYLFGKLKVKGDLTFAIRLTSLFRIPSARG